MSKYPAWYGNMCSVCTSLRCGGCETEETSAERARLKQVAEKQARHEESVLRQKMKLKKLSGRK